METDSPGLALAEIQQQTPIRNETIATPFNNSNINTNINNRKPTSQMTAIAYTHPALHHDAQNLHHSPYKHLGSNCSSHSRSSSNDERSSIHSVRSTGGTKRRGKMYNLKKQILVNNPVSQFIRNTVLSGSNQNQGLLPSSSLAASAAVLPGGRKSRKKDRQLGNLSPVISSSNSLNALDSMDVDERNGGTLPADIHARPLRSPSLAVKTITIHQSDMGDLINRQPGLGNSISSLAASAASTIYPQIQQRKTDSTLSFDVTGMSQSKMTLSPVSPEGSIATSSEKHAVFGKVPFQHALTIDVPLTYEKERKKLFRKPAFLKNHPFKSSSSKSSSSSCFGIPPVAAPNRNSSFGFQNVPLQRFNTIEPKSGAFQTSLSYRLNKKQVEQEHLTIHQFDKSRTLMNRFQTRFRGGSPTGLHLALSKPNLLEQLRSAASATPSPSSDTENKEFGLTMTALKDDPADIRPSSKKLFKFFSSSQNDALDLGGSTSEEEVPESVMTAPAGSKEQQYCIEHVLRNNGGSTSDCNGKSKSKSGIGARELISLFDRDSENIHSPHRTSRNRKSVAESLNSQ